ncbi:MAG: hypothetical protein KBG15_02995 [Kofleriaceae bacterium]|nr:hypothetical protein [Kofleriaceae bacterium]
MFSCRKLRTLAVYLTLTSLVATPSLALAQAPGGAAAAPTAEQIEAAKKLFGEAKTLYEQKKLGDATEKFKEAYKLSKKPLLLYYVGLCLDEQGIKELALFYYKKFMAEAPAATEQRKAAGDRIKLLDTELFSAGSTPPPTGDGKTIPPTGTPPTGTPPTGDGKTTPPTGDGKASKIKPAGTYSATDVQHSVVEDAPPGKPLDVTAVVPDDSGFIVTLMYRAAGEEKFIAKPMRKRYNELVGRIPVDKIKASSVHYYIEAKDQAGTVVDRRGKPSSPNIIYLDAAVQPRFYPDFNDDAVADTASPTRTDTSSDIEGDDPFTKGKDPVKVKPRFVASGDDTAPLVTGNGLTDVGSSKFTYAKWGTTAATGVFLGLGVLFYVRASNAQSTLEQEAAASAAGNCPGGPPCLPFDDYLASAESTGQSSATISQIGLGVGLVTAGFAGYFWYKDLTAKKHVSGSASRNTSGRDSLVVTPAIGQDYAGAAALWSF